MHSSNHWYGVLHFTLLEYRTLSRIQLPVTCIFSEQFIAVNSPLCATQHKKRLLINLGEEEDDVMICGPECVLLLYLPISPVHVSWTMAGF